MNLVSFIIGVVSFIITIYSTYHALRRKKYPGRLTIIKENSVGLFNELANSFEDIKIEFKNAPINKNIIYVKASLVNDGENDINITNSELPVGLKLGTNLKWIQSKVTKSSANVQCETIIADEHNLHFRCGLLRINEFFQFEALIETSDSKVDSNNIFKNITPQHRLPNTQQIAITRYLNEEEQQARQISITKHLIYLTFILIIYCGGAAYQAFFSASTKFEYLKNNTRYEATPLTSGDIEVEELDGGEDEIISIDEFHRSFVPYIPKKSLWGYFSDGVMFLVGTLGAYSIVVILDIIRFRKYRRLSSIIEKQGKQE